MTLVIDASLSLAWYFEDERTPSRNAALQQVVAEGGLVPAIWPIEVSNGFQVAIRRKRIDTQFRDRSLQHLVALPIVIDAETNVHAWSTTIQFADRYGLTPYDAAYLELASRRHLAIGSLDRALCKAASAAGVTVLDLGAS